MLDDLRLITQNSIRRAGPRYTPALDPDAPNLQVIPLVETFDALTFSESFQKRIVTLETKLREAWQVTPTKLRNQLLEKGENSAYCADILELIRTHPIGTYPQLESALLQSHEKIRVILRSYQDGLEDSRRQQKDSSTDGNWPSERQSLDSAISTVRRIGQTLGELHEFLSSPAFGAVYKNRLFLRGSWGTGKTHLLCDIANERIKTGLPTLLVLAQTLPAGGNPFLAVFKAFGLGSDIAPVLEKLDQLGRESGGRALILIDAINEGDRVAWQKHIVGITSLMTSYKNVGLALSCRTPFDRQILPKSPEDDFVFASHQGFADIEFDAQSEFFKYYNIPNPHIPLLAP